MITGATGFVGQALCQELLKQGVQVKAITRRASPGIENLEQIVVPSFDKADWVSILKDVVVIFHLAGRAHVLNETEANPERAFIETNVIMTEQIALAAIQAGVKRFVYVSSIKVYGDLPSSSVLNEAIKATPNEPYGMSKLQAEQLLMSLSSSIEVVIVRPPLVYGAGVKANFLHLLKLVDSKLPLPLGKIKNLRSMVYVGNLVSALIFCSNHKAAAGQVYLVSDQHDISTPKLVKLISSALGFNVGLIPVPLFILKVCSRLLGKSSIYDRLVESLVINSSKISSQLGWQPPFSVDEGIRETVKWYTHNKKLERQ